MNFTAFPSYVTHIIASFLDTSSLAALHATFDLKIHRWLHSPNVIEVCDSSASKNVNIGAINYLLKSLRSIGSLKLSNSNFWNLSFLSLLPTLNPRTLHLSSFQVATMYHVAVARSFEPLSGELATVVEDIKSQGLTILQRLSPRLETLILSNGALLTGEKDTRSLEPDPYIGTRSFSFPTLTTLSIDNVGMGREKSLLADLPSSMTSLTIQYNFFTAIPVIAKYFEAFPVLESLRLLGAGKIDTEGLLILPTSLTSLSLLALSEYPKTFLGFLPISKLIRFDFSLASQPKLRASEPMDLDLASYMPSSLRSMTLYASFIAPYFSAGISISKLPYNLTSLSLTFADDDNSVSSLCDLQDLKYLTLSYLPVSSAEDRFSMRRAPSPAQDHSHSVNPSECISQLPKSLISLTLKGKIFHLGALPVEKLQKLELLHLERSSLEAVSEIKNVLPRCCVKVDRYV